MSKPRCLTAGSGVLALVGGLLVGIPASAQAVDVTSSVVISEVYGGGGNSGATLKRDFIELYNKGTTPIDLGAWSVQYASATGSTWQVTKLAGSIPEGGHFLVGEAFGAGGSVDLPTVDVDGSIAMGATAGKVALVKSQSALNCATSCNSAAGVIDFVGFGTTATDFAGEGPTGNLSASTSAQRTLDPFTNSGNNNKDFTVGAPTPKSSGNPGGGDGGGDGGSMTIAQIQGTGSASPYAGKSVTTKGIVTAAYPTGGMSGYVIQTPDTGGSLELGTHKASDAVFVFSSATVGEVRIGDYVEVTGKVSEFNNLTEIAVPSGGLTKLTDVVPAVKPITNKWPGSDAQRESMESMLFAGSGTYTISDTYSTNQYGEVGLALGETPLMQPTDVARPNTAQAAAVAADNAARGVILDDGATTNFLSAANSGKTPPYVSLDKPLRVGEKATFVDPVIVDYRNGAWKLNPTAEATPATGYPVTWNNDRTEAPANLGAGDLKVASFNVLNYFTTLGSTFPGGCTPYTDRDGNGITTRSCTDPDGPRGAWDAANLGRQQAKIVNAITALDADVVGLMEIENSVKLGETPDEAVSTLVKALNAKAGKTVWAYVPSSADLPPVAEQDVITNAIIYQIRSVKRTGDSHALGDQSSPGEAFQNAREPIAQAFTPTGGGTPFVVVVNHFKSKGSAGPWPGDQDKKDGQGTSNESRVRQATALNLWVPTLQRQTGATDVFLAGDFNSYTQEDPMKVLYDAGWTDVNTNYRTGKQSYSFDGMNGSLDHVLANRSALKRATGSDIWNINAPESVALEYSRYNYHGTLFYDPSPYRSSDHDPVVVGFMSGAKSQHAGLQRRVQILGINDFHGRIQANGQEAGAAVLAGAVQQLREQEPNTVFAAAGDLIGASTFESFIAHDKPTIDALNAAGLDVSAVGNHEFDQGYNDLVNRVMKPYDAATNPYGGATWKYIGANVKMKASDNPALDPTWVKDFGGVQVGFIGAVTEHLPELVSPAGIADIKVTDIPTAVNEEADKLKADGVDIIVLLVHEGAPTSSCDSVTGDNDFGRIVGGVNANVDAIISGHTHLTYNCEVPVRAWKDAGRAVTDRPVVSAGQYGYNLDQLIYTTDEKGKVTGVESSTIALTTQVLNAKGEKVWVGYYPAVQTVTDIVTKAVAQADVLGAQPLGQISGPFNRARTSSGSENRGGESTLGNLVAEAQRWATESQTAGSAQLAFMNPGGLRADMVGNEGGYPTTLTYKQAATVQPFANTLVNMRLTGAQIKKVLEQQWQPAGSSRPFLRLGVSKGFTYSYDPGAAKDAHVTGMWLNGKPVDAATSYSVTVNSFLASGGDNFFELANGTNKKDTGQTDLQGMVDYMAANAKDAPLPVDYSQRSVGVSFPAGAPGSYQPGDAVTFNLSSLRMGASGDAVDGTVSIRIGDTEIGTATVDNAIGTVPNDEYGTASVTVRLPADLPAGATTLTVAGATTGTSVKLPTILVG